MGKEIVLYQGLHNWSAESLINELNNAMGEEVVIRVNSPGGGVFASWGVFAKISEHGDVTIKVDGMAASGAFNLLFYAKRVEVLDVSTFMAHRAAGYDEVNLSNEDKAILSDQNTKLRKKMESKIDPELWKTVTGVSMDDLFASDKRINVWLTSKQMKELGIVSKINKVTPSIAKEIAAATEIWAMDIAASLENDEEVKKEKNSKPSVMTIEKLKAEFPAVYAAIILQGAKEEKDRVEAWLAYNEIDAEAVKKGIESGDAVTVKVMAAMQVKALSAENITALKDGSAPVVKTIEVKKTPEQTAKEKELADFTAEVDGILGVTKK